MERFFTYGFLCISIMMISCKSEDPIVLDDRLSPYFERFAEEASSREVFVELQSTIGGLLKELDDGVSGQCVQSSNSERATLQIDLSYWNAVTDLKREFLVFHELGHCVLNRRHLDRQDDTGSCISMMHSSSQACRSSYSIETRKQYLDELFNPQYFGL